MWIGLLQETGKRQLTRQALLNSYSAGQIEAMQRGKSLTEVN